MTDWADLTTLSLYNTGVLAALNDRTKALAKMDLDAETSLPTGAMHANIDDGKFQRWSGTAWADWLLKAAAFKADNNTYLTWRNAANSADLSLFAADGSDNTVINCPSTAEIRFRANGASKWFISGSTFELSPYTNDAYEIGSASKRVKYLHLSRGIEMPLASYSAAGSNQGDATAITAPGFVTVNGGDGLKGVRLLAAIAGMWALVRSGGAGNAYVYAASGEYMNGTLNGSFVLSAAKSALVWCYQDGRWASVHGA